MSDSKGKSASNDTMNANNTADKGGTNLENLGTASNLRDTVSPTCIHKEDNCEVSSVPSGSPNLTDEEKSRVAELLEGENVSNNFIRKKYFGLSNEDVKMWTLIDKKLQRLKNSYGASDTEDSSQDGGNSDEDEEEWYNYAKTSKFQQIEKQLKELESSANESDDTSE